MRTKARRLVMVAVGTTGLIGLLAGGASAGEEATQAKAPKAKAKTQLVVTPFLLPDNPDQADAAAVCPPGTTLLSGGALSNTPAPAGPPELDTELFRSGPVGDAWFVRYDNDAGVGLLPAVQAICLQDELKVKGTQGAAKSVASASAAKPKAVTKVTQVNTPFVLPPDVAPTNGFAQLDVACPTGTTIAGGGASFSAADVDIRLVESGPQANGWHVRYDNDNGTPLGATASALCLASTLKVKGGEGKAKARSSFEQVDQVVTLPPDATNEGRARFNVSCPTGTTIVGGGGKVDPAAPLPTTDIQLEESGAQGNAWQVTFENDEAIAQTATVHALCLKNKLKVK